MDWDVLDLLGDQPTCTHFHKKQCKHPALFKSLCVSCGEVVIRDNTINNLSKDQKKPAALIVGSGKHLLQLEITSQEAQKIQESKISSLCNENKLALVLDIDHTILHATPSVGPPTAAILEEGIIHLPIQEDPPNANVKHHLVKLRPHIHQFLAEATKLFQITIYTAATRKYAEAVVKVLDPNGTYFSHRIVSRSDNPNDGTLGLDKSLHRIFLDDSGMALIMDDREDVWRGQQGHQLLLVKPFIYFRNGVEVNNAAGPTGALSGPRQWTNMEPIIKLSGDNPGSRLILPPDKHENINASDHDDQLIQSLKHLKEIHANFFELLKKKKTLESSSSSSTSAAETIVSPNTGNILTTMKKSLLTGCTITFSGLIPRNEANPENHHLWRLALALGAQVSFDLCARTTHLITTQTQTEKVKECLQRGDVWVLHPDWLTYCRWSLSKALESTFLIIPSSAGKPLPNPTLDSSPLPPHMTVCRSNISPLIMPMAGFPPHDIIPLMIPPTGTVKKRGRDDKDDDREYLTFRETPNSEDDNDNSDRNNKKIRTSGLVSFKNNNNNDDDSDDSDDDYEYNHMNNQSNSYQRFISRQKGHAESDSSDSDTFGDFDKLVASRTKR
jgi:FCP1-like phosphatase family protein